MSDLAHRGRWSALTLSILTFTIDKLRFGRRGRARIGRDVRLHGHVWIHGGGKIEIRDRAWIDATDLPVELHAEPNGEIIIGEGAEIGGGTSIEATARVLIGAGARIGRLCKVLDNNFHETRGDWNQRPPSQPVEIGAGSIIGDRAILLPGAQVKPGATVSPGAVVRAPRRSAGSDSALPVPAAAAAQRDEPVQRRLWEQLRHPMRSLEVLIALSRARLLFRREERSPGIRLRGDLRLVRGGTLRIGARVTFIGGMIPAFLAARPGATLSIGEDCAFNYGVTLDASVGITLGSQCKFGSMVVLRDDDGEKRGPIVLGDQVWLAHGVIVKPGVSIGSRSVVSAGSVVVKDVAEGSLVAGNPARVGISRPTLRDANRVQPDRSSPEVCPPLS